jgi:hypothetical protein
MSHVVPIGTHGILFRTDWEKGSWAQHHRHASPNANLPASSGERPRVPDASPQACFAFRMLRNGTSRGPLIKYAQRQYRTSIGQPTFETFIAHCCVDEDVVFAGLSGDHVCGVQCAFKSGAMDRHLNFRVRCLVGNLGAAHLFYEPTSLCLRQHPAV